MTDTEKRRARLPGDLTEAERLDRILRVDLAGEYGACRIYEGQLAILGERADAEPIRTMYEQEKAHLATFEQLLVARRARPSALTPLWNVAGFALGAATAMLGREAAMACTVAVEEVIDEHYAKQATQLGGSEPTLTATIEEFRRDELHHRNTGLAEGAERAPAYPLLTGAIRAGSRLAIWLSERV